MKKSIIAAGAASAVLAAMPVVGVFADTTLPNAHTDILSITIDKVCAFGYDSNGSTANGDIEVTGINRQDGATGTWGTATTSDQAATLGNTKATLSRTMLNGTEDLALGTTKLGVYCNNEDGYSITSSFVAGDGTTANATGALAASGVTATIPVSAGIEDAATSAWSYKIASTPAENASNIGVIDSGITANTWLGSATTLVTAPSTGSKMTTNTGDYFTITYGVKIDQTQPSGTYTGGVTYTLAEL